MNDHVFPDRVPDKWYCGKCRLILYKSQVKDYTHEVVIFNRDELEAIKRVKHLVVPYRPAIDHP